MIEKYRADLPPSRELQNPRYSTVILDFHGTITDHQLRLIKALHKTILDIYDVHPAKRLYQRALTRHRHEVSIADILDDELMLLSDSTGLEIDKKRVVELFARHMRETFIPVPGMLPAIKKLMQNGIDVYLSSNATNEYTIRETLYRWKLTNLLHRVFTPLSTQVEKPDPIAIDYILDRVVRNGSENSLLRNRTIIVGDSMADIEVAHNAGIDSALMFRTTTTREIKLEFPYPTYVVFEPADIIKVIAGNYPLLSSPVITTRPTYWRDSHDDPGSVCG